MSLSLGPEIHDADIWFDDPDSYDWYRPSLYDWGLSTNPDPDPDAKPYLVAFAEARPQKIGRLARWFAELGVVGKSEFLAGTVHDTTT